MRGTVLVNFEARPDGKPSRITLTLVQGNVFYPLRADFERKSDPLDVLCGCLAGSLVEWPKRLAAAEAARRPAPRGVKPLSPTPGAA